MKEPLRYFVDLVNREVRGTPPTANGRALDLWESQRARFVEWWQGLSQEERDRRIDAEIERLKDPEVERRERERWEGPWE